MTAQHILASGKAKSGAMRLLAIGAHPDDIEAGCGGTLIKYAQNGHRVFLMVMTEGEFGASRGVRRREQQQAVKALRAEQLYWGGYRDTQLPSGRSLIQKLERIVTAVQPHFIFVHYFDDTHQDHRHLAESTITATRYTKNVLFYEGPTTQNFSPTVFVDIDEVLEDKIASIRAHASQVAKTNIEGLSIVDIIRSAAHFRGIQGRVRNAEGFIPLRLFINV
jgi:LmbE family N-acetylglucosaminyl deacetylase